MWAVGANLSCFIITSHFWHSEIISGGGEGGREKGEGWGRERGERGKERGAGEEKEGERGRGKGGTERVWNLGTITSQLAKRSKRIALCLSMTWMMLLKVEMIFYCAPLYILVLENEPKLKETTENEFVDGSMGAMVSETTRQNSMGFSYTFSWCRQARLFTPPIFL